MTTDTDKALAHLKTALEETQAAMGILSALAEWRSHDHAAKARHIIFETYARVDRNARLHGKRNLPPGAPTTCASAVPPGTGSPEGADAHGRTGIAAAYRDAKARAPDQEAGGAAKPALLRNFMVGGRE